MADNMKHSPDTGKERHKRPMESQYTYLSVNGGCESSSDTQAGCIANVVIMMYTKNTEDRRTKHANGVSIAMPNICTFVLHKLY